MSNEFKENQEKLGSGVDGLVFVGCLMLGLAFGFLLNNLVVGFFAGLGIGFIGMAIARYRAGSW